jgi:hypothetical protein
MAILKGVNDGTGNIERRRGGGAGSDVGSDTGARLLGCSVALDALQLLVEVVETVGLLADVVIGSEG